VSKPIDWCIVGGGPGRGCVHPARQIHQKERIPVDVDIFSGTLYVFKRDTGDSDPSLHLANLQTSLDCGVSGQMRGAFCIFSGLFLPRLSRNHNWQEEL
jgi:hypothetical protein